MATSLYFNNFGASNEQNLIEDLIIESIRMYGKDMYYIPRTKSSVSDVFRDVQYSTFDNPIFVETFTLTSSFTSFLHANGIKPDSRFQKYKINVAGKNFASFDMLFLNNIPGWLGFIDVRKRILDPAILYFDVNNDDVLPSLDVCKKRANTDGNVSHNALLDAWDVIQVLRNKLT